MVEARVRLVDDMRRHGHLPRIIRDSGMLVEAVCQRCLCWGFAQANPSGEYIEGSGRCSQAEEACPCSADAELLRRR